MNGVWLLRAVFGLLGATLLLANVVATKRVWASDLFERSQKTAQTILLWLVPGFVFVVWGVLRERRAGQQSDLAAGGWTFFVDGIAGTGDFATHGGGDGHNGGGHHDWGHDGGSHGGGGFGGHGGDGH
jgi:hypothetical protein